VLVELHIEHLGVIERASLAFGVGLGALTGETGAGKTMLVEAIELLAGGRADSSIVRTGADEARVDGRFVVDRDGVYTETILTRVVPADGRSRAYVNGRPATVASLAAAAADLVDLHGQHAHQGLMEPSAQREALDRFGGIDLGPLQRARARVTEIDAELAALGGDERVRAREIDLLRYQVDELDAAALEDADEDAALANEESTLADAVGHRTAGAAAFDHLRGEPGADDLLRATISELDGRMPYDAVVARLEALVAELGDVAHEIRSLSESIDEDPERLAEIRERRQRLVELRRKYGEDLADVIEFHRQAVERLHELVDFDRRADELDRLRIEATSEVDRAAREVGAARREAAPRLADAVERTLRNLAMPDASMTIEVGDHADGGDGSDDPAGDRVRFMLSANPGSAPLPLQRVASGGELARTMLALRLALTVDRGSDVVGETGGPSTIVFDEVDAGIGGNAANAVGAALADLGRTHQVLVVTHLAQVGARAATHHVVSKRVVDGETYTSVTSVSADDRVDEVARMLAGSVTPEARSHATTLLDQTTSGAGRDV
jgi:DNA repair protein RecN (Recombination protein N)